MAMTKMPRMKNSTKSSLTGQKEGIPRRKLPTHGKTHVALSGTTAAKPSIESAKQNPNHCQKKVAEDRWKMGLCLVSALSRNTRAPGKALLHGVKAERAGHHFASGFGWNCDKP